MKEALSKPEWQIMETLWARQPLFLSEIMQAMEGIFDWQKSTYSTYLRKLCDKGCVGYKTISGNRAYTTIVERDVCIQNESRHMISKMTSKNAKMLLACMIRESGLSSSDCDELHGLISSLSTAEEN